MVWSPGAVAVEFRDVMVFQCYSLYFDTLLARYTEVKYQLKTFFYASFRFDKLLSEIYNVLQKLSSLNHESIIRLKSSIFHTIIQSHQKRNLTTNAMINDLSALNTFLLSKNMVPWKRSYLNIFNLSLFLIVYFEVTLVFFFPTFKENFIFDGNNGPLRNFIFIALHLNTLNQIEYQNS